MTKICVIHPRPNHNDPLPPEPDYLTDRMMSDPPHVFGFSRHVSLCLVWGEGLDRGFRRLGGLVKRTVRPLARHPEVLSSPDKWETDCTYSIVQSNQWSLKSFTHSYTHSHTDGRVSHAVRQPARQEQSG